MSSNREVRAEIERKIRRDAEVRVESKEFAEEVRNHARSIAPVDTGQFAASIKVEKRKDRGGLPAWAVISRDWRAHFIEHGTGPDKKGSNSPFGPDTPTPEFAPFAKTAHHYGGTVDDGIGYEG